MTSPPSPTACPAPAPCLPLPVPTAVPRCPLFPLRSVDSPGAWRGRGKEQRRKPNLSAHKAGCKTRSPSGRAAGMAGPVPALPPLPGCVPLPAPKLQSLGWDTGKTPAARAVPAVILLFSHRQHTLWPQQDGLGDGIRPNTLPHPALGCWSAPWVPERTQPPSQGVRRHGVGEMLWGG